jgi:alkylhydroperoxidase family enzyme
MSFKLHTTATAPAGSQPLLDNSLKSFGMIPNLHAVMAESPQLLKAYQQLHSLFQQSSFDAQEQTVIWQTINVEHQCHYCVPAHTAVADMMNVDDNITAALRDGTALPTAKLQQLQQTTLALGRNRGKLSGAELDAFFAAGYENHHLLDIILGISQKVMSNYINHVAETPLDDAFKPFIWTPVIIEK